MRASRFPNSLRASRAWVCCRTAKLKKTQIAAEAERLAASSGWLPAMFRAPGAVTQDAEPQGEAQETEIAADDEGAEKGPELHEGV